MFNFRNENFGELETIENERGRFYKSPSGFLLPSVTTVVNFGPKPYLDKWKKRVGEKEANRIGHGARNRGNQIHSICEQYLKNEKIDFKNMMPDIKSCLLSLRPFLDTINDIRCLETCLYADKIDGLAGRVDCIANVNNTLSVIDLKGSTKVKTLDQIENYCLQVTAYSWLYESLMNIHIEDAYIAMAVEESGKANIFHIKISQYLTKFFSKVREYQDSINIV